MLLVNYNVDFVRRRVISDHSGNVQAPVLRQKLDRRSKKKPSAIRRRRRALSFGVERVECERTLARARYAADHDELVQRNCEGDVLEIVLARALDQDGAVVIRGRYSIWCRLLLT
jgi:hypothetical protein